MGSGLCKVLADNNEPQRKLVLQVATGLGGKKQVIATHGYENG